MPVSYRWPCVTTAPVFVGVLPQMFLGGGELNFALLADVVLDQVFQRIENPRREDVHAEMGEIVSRRQARRRELLAATSMDGFSTISSAL